MPKKRQSLWSWLTIRLYKTFVQHLLYGCVRWWQLEDGRTLLNRMLDLEWNQYTSRELSSIREDLLRMASAVDQGDHPLRKDLAEELRWVAGYVAKLTSRWNQQCAVR